MKKTRTLRRIRKRLYFLILFFLILLFVLFFIINSLKHFSWHGKHSFNLVIQNQKVMIFSFHPKDDLLNILIIDPHVYLPVVRGYGSYKIANIFKLGELEKIGGGELLSLSLQKFFAIPIDAYLVKNPNLKSRHQNIVKENFFKEGFFDKTKLLFLYFSLM